MKCRRCSIGPEGIDCAGAGMDAGLQMPAFCNECLKHLEGGLRRRVGPRPAAPDKSDDTPREFGHADHSKRSGEPIGHRRRGNDGSTEAVEGKRSQKTHAVDFRLGAQGDVRRRRSAFEHLAER